MSHLHFFVCFWKARLLMGSYLYHKNTNPDIFSGLPKVVVKFGFHCRFPSVSCKYYMEDALILYYEPRSR